MVDNLFCGHVACYCIILRKKLKSCQLYLNFLNKDWMCLPLHIGCDFYHCLQKRGDVFVLSWKDWSSLFCPVLLRSRNAFRLDHVSKDPTVVVAGCCWFPGAGTHCQLMSSLSSTGPLKSSSAGLLSVYSCPSLNWYQGLSWTSERDCPEQEEI